MCSPSIALPLALALCLALGCSDGGSTPADGGGSGGAGGDGGGQPDGGGSDTAGACTRTVAQAAAFCQSNLNDQIASGTPCDSDFMPITRTCGSYKVWQSIFIGSQTCVYDTAGATLVAARDCDSAFTDMCPSGCYVYGLPESAYATGCSTDTPACP